MLATSQIDWETIAHRRLRLAAAALIVGFITGIIFMAIVSMPPVWLGQL